eukprot:symbB.v1.2.010008.t1/scaffold645.1/size176818/7
MPAGVRGACGVGALLKMLSFCISSFTQLNGVEAVPSSFVKKHLARLNPKFGPRDCRALVARIRSAFLGCATQGKPMKCQGELQQVLAAQRW